MPNKNKNTLIQKIVNRICESDGANANLKIKRNERKKAEQDENKYRVEPPARLPDFDYS